MEDKLTLKQQLVEEAKKLAENNDGTSKRFAAMQLQQKFKRTRSDEESLLDQELEDQFNKYMDMINANESESQMTYEEHKAAIINAVRELKESTNFKAATAKMNELFEEFKHAGRCAKDVDDRLWDEFKNAKDDFYNSRKIYYEELSKKFENNKVAKESLIAKAKEVLSSENFTEAGKKMDELMAEWKTLGNAGKECNDDLWISFNDVRKEFYKKKNEYYAHMKEVYAQRVETKKELIAKAKHCLAMHEFTDEEVAEVKAIRAEWKAVGFAGKDNEESLWNEFNETMNKYFEEMKYYKN